MKTILLLIISNSVAMILASLAFWMVMHDKPYYGWVILASAATAVYQKKES